MSTRIFLAGLIFVASMLSTLPAVATIRPSVGLPLQDALKAAEKHDYDTAMKHLNEADAVSDKTAEEIQIIAQVKTFVAFIKPPPPGSALGHPLGFLPNMASAANCFEYGPRVTVSGTISMKTANGPTDKKESYLSITLDRPLCVDGDNDPRSPNTESETNVKSMQMVYDDGYPFQKTWLGHHVSVRGTLFHATTAHHYTSVLITAQETHVLPARKSSN